MKKKIRSKYYKEPELKESHRFESTYAMDTPRKNVRGVVREEVGYRKDALNHIV